MTGELVKIETWRCRQIGWTCHDVSWRRIRQAMKPTSKSEVRSRPPRNKGVTMVLSIGTEYGIRQSSRPVSGSIPTISFVDFNTRCGRPSISCITGEAPTAGPSPFQRQISRPSETLKATIEDALTHHLPVSSEHAQVLTDAMRYATLSGGKRIRPLLVCATCTGLGGNLENALAPACAVEFLEADPDDLLGEIEENSSGLEDGDIDELAAAMD